MKEKPILLLVDTDPALLCMMKVILDDLGYTVYIATDPNQAEFYIRNHTLHLITTNTTYFSTTNTTLVSRSRLDFIKTAREKHPKTKIILWTGNRDTTVFAPFVDLTVLKPIEVEDLINLIERQLASRHKVPA